MALDKKAFGGTVDMVHRHSQKVTNQVLKTAKLASDDALGRTANNCRSNHTVDIPHELVPYLSRIQTQDIINYLSDPNANGDGIGVDNRDQWQKFAWRILRIQHLESFMSIIIVLNMIVMVVETDRTTTKPNTPGIGYHWTEVFGYLVLVIFVLELILRLLLLQCAYFRDPWNLFDLVIVVVDAIFSVIGIIAGSKFPVTALRICRLAKLARVFKVLRVFPELRLLLEGLMSCLTAIFWGSVLLFFALIMWSLVAVLIIHPLNETIDYGDCERCSRAYSSVMHSSLTFWQSIVAGDSWGETSIPVIERYPASALFFISVYLSVGMAVTNLILGVVVNVAQQALAALSEEDRTEMALAQLGRTTHLLELCKEMDTDNSGELSQQELMNAFEANGDFRETVDNLGVTKDDFEIVWSILDVNRNGSVSYKELVSQLSSIRTNNTEFMLNYIKYNISLLRNSLLEKMEIHHQETLNFERQLTAKVSEVGELLSDEELNQSSVEEGVNSGSNGCHEGGQIQSKAFSVSPQKLVPNMQRRASKDTKQLQVFDTLRNEIETSRAELKGMLMDMDRKLGQQVSQMCAQDRQLLGHHFSHQYAQESPRAVALRRLQLQQDLLAMPQRESTGAFAPKCCQVHQPERGATRIPGSGVGSSPTVMSSAFTPMSASTLRQ